MQEFDQLTWGTRMNKVCTISTIKAPLSETLMFVNYHLNIGIDQIIIFFDDPNDAAADYLKDYRGVTCVRCDDSYWEQYGGLRPLAIEDRQVVNNNNGLEMAKSRGFQWAIFIDNDELVYPVGDLKTILSDSRADVIRFTIHEAISEEEYYDNIYVPALFKKPARSLQIRAAMLLGCKRAFFEGGYFRGHLDSKVAVRVNADIKIMGIHGPSSTGEGVIKKITPQVKLLHYDWVGIDSWKTKWLGRMNVSAVKGLRGIRKSQLELFAKALHKDGEELRRLYRQVYLIPKYEQVILRWLNMLTMIQLDRKLFEPPKNVDGFPRHSSNFDM